jgi:hypothetical protein
MRQGKPHLLVVARSVHRGLTLELTGREVVRLGVFFRYPTRRDSTKSANKPIAPEELAAWDKDQYGYLGATHR